MGLINSLDELDPSFLPFANKYLDELTVAGIRHAIIETRRTADVQHAYYAQGRLTLVEVNIRRKTAGLWPISEKENKYKVTDSELLVYKGVGHGNGTAMDVVPLNASGKPTWNVATEIWFAMGEIAELSGLDWGGRFKPLDRNGLGWDPGHVQMRRK